MFQRLGLAVLLLGTLGCVVRRTIEVSPTSSKPVICADGAPVKILQDPACVNGICGYTCEPDRWKEPDHFSEASQSFSR